MGGVGFMDIAKTVIGVGGVVGSTMAASSQAKYMNQLMSEGSEQRGRVAGIDNYFMGGGRAQGLAVPGFQEQFSEIDFAVQEQLRNLEREAGKSRQMISDTLPAGGAKLRALADLAMRTQEEKSKVVKEAQTRKRDLDVQLTNQYLQAAMGRQHGVSMDARMSAALQDYGGRQRDIAALGSALGGLAEGYGGQEAQPGVEYTGQVPQQVTPPASEWGGYSQEEWLNDPLLVGPQPPQAPRRQKVVPEFGNYRFTY
jgi:hypothetical protein